MPVIVGGSVPVFHILVIHHHQTCLAALNNLDTVRHEPPKALEVEVVTRKVETISSFVVGQVVNGNPKIANLV